MSKIKVQKPVYPFQGYENLSEYERNKLIFNSLVKNKKDYYGTEKKRKRNERSGNFNFRN